MADYGELLLQGMNTGSSLYSRGAELSLRRQQLESERALRQLQQEHIAQQMQLELAKHNEEVDMKAQAAKAAAEFEVLSAPVIPMPMGTSGQTVLAPNPMKAPSSGHAFIQAFGKLARNPKEAADIASTGAMMTMRDAQAEYFSQRPDIETAKEQGRNTRAQLANETKLTLEDMRAQWHQDVAHINAQSRLDAIKEKFAQDQASGKLSPALAAHYLDDLRPEEKRLTTMLHEAEKRHKEATDSLDKQRILTTTRALRNAQMEYDEGIKKIIDETNERMIRLSLKPKESPPSPSKDDSDDPWIPMLGKDGKTRGKVRRSQVDDALNEGYQLIK